MPRRAIATVAGAALLASMSGSAADARPATTEPAGVGAVVPGGFAVAELVTGLVGPTQVVRHGDDLIVAQLNGGEADGAGQVVRIALDDTTDREVLYDGLLKPTGVAVLGDEVWVMEERTLSRGPLSGGELQVELDELPYNGRSEGTLTVTDDGALLYNTSGAIGGTDAAPGSGVLWSIVPGSEPEAVGSGFKHAYGRTIDEAGTLWQTEIADGTYDGEPAPDELVIVEFGDDFGWPKCIGDRVPVEFYDGTEERCNATPPSFALFDPGATPTSVAIAPWDHDVVLVALWNDGRVVALDRLATDLPAPADDFLTGIDHPQHLLADGERLLVVDFGGGRVLAVTPAR